MLGERHFEPRQGVVGDVEPEHLSLEREFVLLDPLRSRRDFGRRRLFHVVVQAVEVEADRALRLVPLAIHSRLDGILVDLEQGSAGVPH